MFIQFYLCYSFVFNSVSTNNLFKYKSFIPSRAQAKLYFVNINIMLEN